ncbi:hypothetical protein [Paraclostridium bifermentans]|uniref:hypothetical protein n=1 Tax=Paraclostridium bifermentans TaxID=1490 RepID=UPI00374FDA48
MEEMLKDKRELEDKLKFIFKYNIAWVVIILVSVITLPKERSIITTILLWVSFFMVIYSWYARSILRKRLVILNKKIEDIK